MNRDTLILALVRSKNEAADDVLLEGLQVGSEEEKPLLVTALFKRKTLRGLGGLISGFDSLSPALQKSLVDNLPLLHHAILECARSDRREWRLGAMRLISVSRQGKLAHVLSENLHGSDETVAVAAVEAIVTLAQGIAGDTALLQRPDAIGPAAFDKAAIHKRLLAQRPDIEATVARALDVSRGKHTSELLRAALLLCDSPQSRTLAILQSSKHGGHSLMARRLQQPPESEHVDAFLLGASHGQLRSHFGTVFAHINEAPVLDAILRKTHWLKDEQLQVCMRQAVRGAWLGEAELQHDVGRRTAEDAATISDWVSASGAPDVVQDERLEQLRKHGADSFDARLRILRNAMRRPRGGSCQLLKQFLADPDERLMRMAARELIRRKPTEYENCLLQRMTSAPLSVRRMVSRSLGHVGFEQFWIRFDTLTASTRKQAGRAMLKLLPDAASRLRRRLASGPVEQRLKAIQMSFDLGLASDQRDLLLKLTEHPNPRVRSKAVGVLAEVPAVASDVLLERVLNDSDSRVRANAVEALEATRPAQFVPLLATRARTGHNRERANSIKALHQLKVGPAGESLLAMLRDERPEHRVSAMWVLRHIGWWRLLGEVGRLAKEDQNLRVRRYALGVLKNVAQSLQTKKEKVG